MLLASFLLSNPATADQPEALAIINGEDVDDPSTFPFMASLQGSAGSNSCGGSIIGESWILTAAHCLVNEDGSVVDADAYEVMVGAVDLSEQNGEDGNRQLIEAVQILIHPNYDGNVDNDVGLIELNGAIDLDGTYTAVISLAATNNLTSGQDLKAIGWGNTEGAADADGDYPDRLQVATVDFITSQECTDLIGYFDTHGRLCAGTKDTDTCDGDSGGPLISEAGVLYGLTSYGVSDGCGQGVPGIYTEVSCYLDWIGETTGIDFGESTCGDGSEDGILGMDEETLYLVLGIGIGTIFLLLAVYSIWRVCRARKEDQTGIDETPKAQYGAV